MEVKEAIEHCDEIIKKMDKCECRKEHEELKEFLEELQEYKDTELTPAEIWELKEQDMAKEPISVDEDFGYFECPSCGEAIYASDDLESHKFCLNCGQRIKWED